MNVPDNKKAALPLQLQQMQSASKASLIASMLLAATLAYMQREVISSSVVVVWFSLIALVTFFRAALVVAYRRSPVGEYSAARARIARLRLGVLIAGAVWGSAGFLMFPAGNPAHQMFLIFMLAGLTAGGVVSYSADLVSGLGFSLLALVPIVIRLFVVGDSLSAAMAMAGILYLGFMIMAIRNYNLNISENILLRFEAADREETIRSSEEYYRLLLRYSPVGIFHYDTNLVITYCNESFANILNNSVEHIVGLDMKTLRDQSVLPYLRGVLNGITGVYKGNYHATLSKAVAWVEMTCAPSRDGNGRIEGGIAIVRDISESMEKENALKVNEWRLLEAQKIARLGFIEVNLESGGVYMSDQTCSMYGVEKGEVRQMSNLLSLVHPDDLALVQDRINRTLSGEQEFDIEHRILRPDGLVIWTHSQARLIKDDNDQATRLIGTTLDITAHKEAERMVVESRAKYKHLVENLPAIVYEYSDKRGGLYYSPQVADILGYEADQLCANPYLWNESIHPADVRIVEQGISAFNAGGNFDITYRIKDRNGNWHWFNDRSIDKREENGETVIIGLTEDVTERKLAEEQIKYLAFFDPLTHLPNRRLLMDRLHQAQAFSARMGREGAVLFLDLDNFKTLNDVRGHEIGDLLLQQVAQRLASCVRDGDTVARLGGDEFVVVLENLSKLALEAAGQTETIGEKILANLSKSYRLAGNDYQHTVSIGATLFFGQQTSIEELMKQADIAMYQAKKAGRNTMRFFDQKMQASITDRVLLESELHKALEQQQFQLYYQIQVDTTHHPIGAETLIRWIHPVQGMVPPAQFIPLAEETGLILSIGQWVLNTACARIKAWQQDARTRDLIVSVNVSAKQFRQADFVAQVQNHVLAHAINPTLLKLELTESLLLDNIEDTIATDTSDKAIVKTIIAMAHSLNLDVIAEGVETEAQRQFLIDEGCSHFQGYLFGKPVPVEQFEASLKRGVIASAV